MAELTYKSPGVGVREIDLSGPTSAKPSGIPAGVIGTAERGPAFVPVIVANYREFSNTFGDSGGKRFGPVTMYQWLKNSNSGQYIRILGVGNAKQRNISGDNAGKVTNAGFVVGSKLIQSTGDFGVNPYAYDGQTFGRTYFLGCFMSASSGSPIFHESGLQTSSKAAPILRGVLMVPSGVTLSLSASAVDIDNSYNRNIAPNAIFGHVTGTVTGTRDEFVMFLSGHINSQTYPNIVTASFDPKAPNYFGNIFNTDAVSIEKAGHYLYASWDIDSSIATVTASHVPGAIKYNWNSTAFVFTGKLARNSGSTDSPNFENFEDRFRTAQSPWIVSQNFGGENYKLFKVHALDDGSWANERVKISIRNITPSSDPTSEYGTFDLVVRDFNDTDDKPTIYENFIGLSLNPASQNYFGRMIGDVHTYYDFDRTDGNQKLISDGLYPNRSRYIRVEIEESVQNQEVPASSLPVGFKGYWYLNTSGSNALYTQTSGLRDQEIAAVSQPPVPFRKKITVGTNTAERAVSYLHWGVQFENVDSLSEPNKNLYSNNNVRSYSKYFPNFQIDWKDAQVTDETLCDSFANNLFTLENIGVVTASDGKPDPNLWTSASYCRDGIKSSQHSRLLEMSDFSDIGSRKYLKFTLFLQGGFDGSNIFDKQKLEMSSIAANREMTYPNTQGASAGPTISAYRKAIDVISEKSETDIQLLAIPGMRDPGVTDYALDAVENRFDALYIMDIPEYNGSSSVITSSVDVVSVGITSNTFANRQLDSSFAAAYFPDVVVPTPETGIEMVVPPSAAVLGAFALNDRIGYPWFAPAGFTRGALGDVVETQVKLNRDNMDALYSSNINPIATIPGSPSPIVNGQKTLLNRQSALDRINVRRLLIEIRRRVRSVANGFLFEPNREVTLNNFSAAVNPILTQIQAQSGVDRFLVKIDTTTTTQADVENNTIRGKIFVQPTKAIEFVSLDFVVSNSGVSV